MMKLHPWYQSYGIELSPSKCGWVKRNNVWLKPLKFLGLTYDGVADTLTASTRNGSTLSIHTKDDLLSVLLSPDVVLRGSIQLHKDDPSGRPVPGVRAWS